MKEPSSSGYHIESVWSLVALVELIRQWRDRIPAASSSEATLIEGMARELEDVLQRIFDEEVTVEQLAQCSGHSVREVREWLEEGLLPDLGVPGRPSSRRREITTIAVQRAQEYGLFRHLTSDGAPGPTSR